MSRRPHFRPRPPTDASVYSDAQLPLTVQKDVLRAMVERPGAGPSGSWQSQATTEWLVLRAALRRLLDACPEGG